MTHLDPQTPETATFDLTGDATARSFGEPEPKIGPVYWTGERIAGWVAGAGAIGVFLTFCVMLIVLMIQRIL